MYGHLLGYRLRPSQMAQFVLPNANTTRLAHWYSTTYSFFNEEEY